MNTHNLQRANCHIVYSGGKTDNKWQEYQQRQLGPK